VDGEEFSIKEIKIKNRLQLEEAIKFFEKNQIQESIKILDELYKNYPQDKTIQYLYKKISSKELRN
jgi:predicted Zn-dependent protease